jgi:hypothetical protein
MNNVLAPFVDQVRGGIDRVIEFAEKNPELTESVLTLAGAFVVGTGALTALGLGLTVVKTAAIALLTTALSPIGVALAVGAVLVMGYLNNWMGFRDYVDGTLRPTLDNVWDDFKRWHGILNDIKTILDGLMSGRYDVGQVVKAAGGSIKHSFDNSPGVQQVASGVNSGNAGDIGQGLLDAYNAFNSNPITNPIGALVGFVNNNLVPRASGGPVSRGGAYMVGEDGPEMFVPNESGTIVPNGASGVTFNIYQRPGEDGTALASRVHQKMVNAGYLGA